MFGFICLQSDKEDVQALGVACLAYLVIIHVFCFFVKARARPEAEGLGVVCVCVGGSGAASARLRDFAAVPIRSLRAQAG